MRRRTCRFPIGEPSSQAWPEVGSVSPSSSFTEVVFPAPLGPRKPKTSPLGTVIVRPARAVTWPYFLARSWVWTAGVSARAAPCFDPLGGAVGNPEELLLIEVAADRVNESALFPNQPLDRAGLVGDQYTRV